MTADEIAYKANQLSTIRLIPADEIEGRLGRWRKQHEEMAETLAVAAKAIGVLKEDNDRLADENERLKAGDCPVGPLRRFLQKLRWTPKDT